MEGVKKGKGGRYKVKSKDDVKVKVKLLASAIDSKLPVIAGLPAVDYRLGTINYFTTVITLEPLLNILETGHALAM